MSMWYNIKGKKLMTSQENGPKQVDLRYRVGIQVAFSHLSAIRYSEYYSPKSFMIIGDQTLRCLTFAFWSFNKLWDL